MTRYVLDSWAWIEYFEGSPKGKRVKEIIFDSRNETFTHSVSAAEIISKGKRSGKDTDEIWMAITNNSKIVDTDADDSKDTGIVHANVKSKNRNFSLADAFVLSTARKLKAKVLTGDSDFKNIDEAMML